MPYFDRFDICAAYWTYAAEWHGGQGSKEYALFSVFSRLRYRNPPDLHKRYPENENARTILAGLIRSRGRNIRDRRADAD